MTHCHPCLDPFLSFLTKTLKLKTLSEAHFYLNLIKLSNCVQVGSNDKFSKLLWISVPEDCSCYLCKQPV